MPALDSPRSLREHLTRARAHLDRGETPEALALVEAALAADPGFLAARALQELIQSRATAAPAAAGASLVDPALPSPSPVVRDNQIGASAGVGMLAIEQRARHRRMIRRLESMRRALAAGRVDEARTALDEARGIDQRDAAIVLASAELKLYEARGAARPRTSGVGIALWFAAVVLGGAWVASQWLDTRATQAPSRADRPARPDTAPPPLPEAKVAAVASAPTAPVGITVPGPGDGAPASINGRTPDRPAPPPKQSPSPPPSAPRERRWPPTTSSSVSTASGRRSGAQTPVASPLPTPEVPHVASGPASARPVPSPPAPVPIAPPAVAIPADGLRSAEAPAIPRGSAAVGPGPVPAAAPAIGVTEALEDEDERLVRLILQRYEAAYEALDARSAQGVWPGVNADALARAFAGLITQELRFDECGVDIRGNAAVATCRGFVRYVPKVGRQAPRMDSREWTFALEKQGPGWLIASARTTAR